MLVDIKLNGKSVKADITADMTLYEFVREHGLSLIHIWYTNYEFFIVSNQIRFNDNLWRIRSMTL